MKGHFLTRKEIERFRNYLRAEEKSENTKIKFGNLPFTPERSCSGVLNDNEKRNNQHHILSDE